MPSKTVIDGIYSREFEIALRKYAHPQVVQDFDAMDPKDQSKLLEGMAWKAMDDFRELMYADTTNAITTNYGHKSSKSFDDLIRQGKKADPSCPLGKVLTKLGAKHVPEHLLCSVRDNLKTWGRPSDDKMSMILGHRMQEYMLAQQHQQQQSEDKDKKCIHTLSTSNKMTKDNVKQEKFTTKPINWATLKPIQIQDLKLFNVCTGCVLEGTLIANPLIPLVGCTTLVEDNHGDAIILTLYNMVPAGLSNKDANKMIASKLPSGSKVRIAEPFLKIFRDGRRGIRLDNPHEIQIVQPKSNGPGRTLVSAKIYTLEEARAEGNEFVAKKMYHAAAEIYLRGLRNETLVPTLLSNRAQVNIKLEKWYDAMADTAASLTIRPNCKKTWFRYKKACNELQKTFDIFDKSQQVRNIIKGVFSQQISNATTYEVVAESEILQMKAEGNKAFINGDFEKARDMYSEALQMGGGVCQKVLNNWSLCCLLMCAFNDTIASAAAALRIAMDPKAIYRLAKALLKLCEPSLASQVLDMLKGNKALDRSKEMQDLKANVAKISHYLNNQMLCQPGIVYGFSTDLLPYWYCGIEVFDAGRKGRGVRATKNLDAGQVILIEHSLVSCVRTIDESDMTLYMATGKRNASMGAHALVPQILVSRCEREHLLTAIVSNLYDGVTKSPMVSFNQMIPDITSTPILLPSHHEYYANDKDNRGSLTAKRIEGVVNTNTFGKDIRNGASGDSTMLFPACAMFNHSASPTCVHQIRDNCFVVLVIRNIQKDEELTLRYHDDDEVARRAWKII